MQTMPNSFETAGEWSVFVFMREVLRKVGDEYQTGQKTSFNDVGSDQQVQEFSWPGRNLGVRRPDVDETALSPSEVKHAMKIGVV